MVSRRRFRRLPCTNRRVSRYKGGIALTDPARCHRDRGLSGLGRRRLAHSFAAVSSLGPAHRLASILPFCASLAPTLLEWLKARVMSSAEYQRLLPDRRRVPRGGRRPTDRPGKYPSVL